MLSAFVACRLNASDHNFCIFLVILVMVLCLHLLLLPLLQSSVDVVPRLALNMPILEYMSTLTPGHGGLKDGNTSVTVLQTAQAHSPAQNGLQPRRRYVYYGQPLRVNKRL